MEQAGSEALRKGLRPHSNCILATLSAVAHEDPVVCVEKLDIPFNLKNILNNVCKIKRPKQHTPLFVIRSRIQADFG